MLRTEARRAQLRAGGGPDQKSFLVVAIGTKLRIVSRETESVWIVTIAEGPGLYEPIYANARQLGAPVEQRPARPRAKPRKKR